MLYYMIYVLFFEFVTHTTHVYLSLVFIVSELIFKIVLSTILRSHESKDHISVLRHYLTPLLDISNLYISVNE